MDKVLHLLRESELLQGGWTVTLQTRVIEWLGLGKRSQGYGKRKVHVIDISSIFYFQNEK